MGARNDDGHKTNHYGKTRLHILKAKRGNVERRFPHKLSFDSHNRSLPGVGGRSFRIHENVDRECGFKSKPKPVRDEMHPLSVHSPLPLACDMCWKSEIKSY